eukprot:gnl/TRDRNA2_/TRDRNA2_201041_c0_seq1.p1 gnl/TRDRNA2_/TRDRNA2_201041_c0~~gnl/TRDRNA2_/TRDRNA2_201041_c0_seq1.p1  ORF type:complete len:278 (+),score=16.70 gnl/TRDRNA2_/TRDRNA2_201041_c0_seq1:61-894(+)
MDPFSLPAFRCPITHGVMMRPVMTPYGHSYDEDALLAWLRTHQDDPMTNMPLSADMLYPNRSLQKAIVEHFHALSNPDAEDEYRNGQIARDALNEIREFLERVDGEDGSHWMTAVRPHPESLSAHSDASDGFRLARDLGITTGRCLYCAGAGILGIRLGLGYERWQHMIGEIVTSFSISESMVCKLLMTPVWKHSGQRCGDLAAACVAAPLGFGILSGALGTIASALSLVDYVVIPYNSTEELAAQCLPFFGGAFLATLLHSAVGWRWPSLFYSVGK